MVSIYLYFPQLRHRLEHNEQKKINKFKLGHGVPQTKEKRKKGNGVRSMDFQRRRCCVNTLRVEARTQRTTFLLPKMRPVYIPLLRGRGYDGAVASRLSPAKLKVDPPGNRNAPPRCPHANGRSRLLHSQTPQAGTHMQSAPPRCYWHVCKHFVTLAIPARTYAAILICQ